MINLMRRTDIEFKNFSEFYPIYLREHSHIMCRRFHFLATSGVISTILLFFFTGHLGLLALLPFVSHGIPWFAHFFFEKNSPMSLGHPFYNLRADFKMFWDILTGRVRAF